jgi:hypothetical protein
VVVVAVLLLASPAWAAPAVVKVFEAAARAAPSADAAVVHVFPEQTKISVSEEVTDGWRRVRLPDGKTAYVRDDQIKLVVEQADEAADAEAETPAAETAPHAAPPRPVEPLRRPPTVSARPPRARATIYVKDLDHLAELVASDQVVHPQAEALADRHKWGLGLLTGGLIAGTAVGIGSYTVWAGQDCIAGYPAGSPDLCTKRINMTAMVFGLVLCAAGTIGWLAVMPKRGDLLDVVNAWNERHPDEPFTIESAPRSNFNY